MLRFLSTTHLTLYCFLVASYFFLVHPGFAANTKPTLTVYTYSSFLEAGKELEKVFEKQCDCDLRIIALDSSGTLVTRLMLEGDQTKADVVLGLDNNTMVETKKLDLVIPHNVQTKSLSLPIDWQDPDFLPYDFGYFTLMYDSKIVTSPPQSFDELVQQNHKIIIQDPRTSASGLGLILWIQSIYGDQAPDFWNKLRPLVSVVTKGWSDAYGLFLKGEAPLVVSYTTSAAYHLIEERSDRYRSVKFKDGHFLQVEVAAIVKSSKNQTLAKSFLEFLISPTVQSVIPSTNWMYPVIDLKDKLPSEFRYLPQPAKILLIPSDDISENRKTWIHDWLNVFSKDAHQ